MTETITGLFDQYDDARSAVEQLEAVGVPHEEISIVGHGQHHTDNAAEHAAADAGPGAGIGATVGGVGGLLTGLGLLAIPGVGPVVAAGWLAATAVGVVGGALVGAAAGGLVGALTHAGVSEDDANVYAEGVRRGGTLVTAKVHDALAPTARGILLDDRTVNVAERRQAYTSQGWSKFDEGAPVYSEHDIAADRDRYDRV